MGEFVVKPIVEQQQKLDTYVAKFFQCNYIAYNAISSKHANENGAFGSDYVEPNCKQIAGTL